MGHCDFCTCKTCLVGVLYLTFVKSSFTLCCKSPLVGGNICSNWLQLTKPQGCHLYTIACSHHWPDTFIFHPKHGHAQGLKGNPYHWPAMTKGYPYSWPQPWCKQRYPNHWPQQGNSVHSATHSKFTLNKTLSLFLQCWVFALQWLDQYAFTAQALTVSLGARLNMKPGNNSERL